MNPSLPYDIRAEVWANTRFRAAPDVPLLVRHRGNRDRFCQPDFRMEQDGSGRLGGDVLLLNRMGLYDTLPEVLFHPPPVLRPGEALTPPRMVDDSRYGQRQEAIARQFWLPFEQELFRQRVSIEAQEADVMTQSEGAVWQDLQTALCGPVPFPLSAAQRISLLTIWLNAHRIAGDWAQTAAYCAEFLGVPVRLSYRASASQSVGLPPLGQGLLDNDLILIDNAPPDEGGTICFHVGPLASGAELVAYLPGGQRLAQVQLLADYLLPADVDWVVEPVLAARHERLILDDEDVGVGRLDVSSVLV